MTSDKNFMTNQAQEYLDSVQTKMAANVAMKIDPEYKDLVVGERMKARVKAFETAETDDVLLFNNTEDELNGIPENDLTITAIDNFPAGVSLSGAINEEWFTSIVENVKNEALLKVKDFDMLKTWSNLGTPGDVAIVVTIGPAL